MMNFCQNVVLNVINMSVTASIIIVFVLLARILLKKSPKIFSYVLWVVVLFRLLCPVSVTTDFSLLGLFNVTAREETKHTTSINYIPQEIDTTYLSKIVIPNEEKTSIGQETELQQNNNILPEIKENGNILTDEVTSTIKWSPMMYATVVWMVGAVGILAYSVFLLIRIQCSLVGAVHMRDNIYLADYIESPFVIGLVSPKIYLPSNLLKQELEYIVLHEQHHIRRRDHIVKWLAFLALCIHWFNPLVWVAFILSSKDMEMSCDEAVVKKLGGEIQKEYSASLLSLATGRRIIAGTPLAFGEGNTKSRIENVLKWRKPKVWISAVAVVFCVIAVIWCIGNPNVDAKANNEVNGISGEHNLNDKEDAGNADSGNIDVSQENSTNKNPGNESEEVQSGISTDDQGDGTGNNPSENLWLDSVLPRVPKQGEYGSVEDIAFYCELASLGKTFQDMSKEQGKKILEEYEGLLGNYTMIARESEDGKTAYIVGVYNELLENSVLYGIYGMELGIGEDETVQLLYDAKDENTVNEAIGEGKYPEEGYIIKNSTIYYSSDYGIILIQPRESELKFDTVFNRYLYTSNGRAYMIDAASRGIALTGCEEPYIYIYLIPEEFGEIAERIPITVAEAEAIMTEERVELAKGYGFCASLHYNGETTYYTEMTKAPQSVIDMAVERCNYKFATPNDIDEPIVKAVLECDWLNEEIQVEGEALERLREILTNAEFGFVGGCGYGAKLTITLEGGEEITVFKGCDGCDSMVFGSYGGYFIGDKGNTEFWKLFDLDPETKEPIE